MKFYNSDINSLIADAIVNCKELLLEDICTLSCKLTSSREDINGTITPPKYIIEAKKEPSNPNNSAIQLIAAAYNIGMEEATEAYSKWLESTEKCDDDTKTYAISGVGVITKGAYNSISFKAERQILSNLNFLNEKIESESVVAAAVAATPIAATPKIKKISKIEDKKENNNSKIVIYIIIALALIALLALLIVKCNKREVVIEPKVEEIAAVDTINVEEEQPKIESIKDGKYHVICGVYEEESNADRSVASYKAEGYAPVKEFFAEKGRFYISLKGFDDRAEAQKLLNSITPREEEGEDGYLWIYQHQQ